MAYPLTEKQEPVEETGTSTLRYYSDEKARINTQIERTPIAMANQHEILQAAPHQIASSSPKDFRENSCEAKQIDFAECRTCNKVVKVGSIGLRALVWHVIGCKGLRPYKCCGCGKQFTQKGKVQRHQKSLPGCDGLGIEVEDRETNESIIRQGLAESYGREYAWKGL